MTARKLWTRDELVVSLNLYLKLPFGKLHSGTPEIRYLSSLIGRSANAVAMRLNNFASVDPYHKQRGVKGLTGGAKQVQPIWDEFMGHKDELLFESERIMAELEQRPLEIKYADTLRNIEHLKGEDKVREVKTRVNQRVFREIVLVNYDHKCALTGIDISDLLVASHILPWAKDQNERLNPENGICLSSLYDRAFDKGYIGFNDKYEVVISPALRKSQEATYYGQHFSFLTNAGLQLPQKYLPKKEFLRLHMDTIFRK